MPEPSFAARSYQSNAMMGFGSSDQNPTWMPAAMRVIALALPLFAAVFMYVYEMSFDFWTKCPW